MSNSHHSTAHTYRRVLRGALLIAAASLALLTSVSYAQWQEPTDQPPQGNVPPPLHVSSESQTKIGNLVLGGLQSNSQLVVAAPAPVIKLQDNDHRDWWLHADNDRLYLIADRNDDGRWSGEDPWPLSFTLDTDLSDGRADDWARVSNQVRANEYCDENGQNCWSPARDPVGGGGSTGLPSCAAGELLKYNNSDWECAADTTGGGISLPISCPSGEFLQGIDASGRAICY